MEFFPLVWNTSYTVDPIGLVVMNTKIVYYNVTLLFTDPQNETYYMYYAAQGNNPLPVFVHDEGNGTLVV